MDENLELKVPLKVLILEDSLPDAELMQELLASSGYDLQVTRVDKENELIAELKNSTFDIILSDYNLPGFNGMQALELTMKMCPEVPFICISGHISEEIAVDMLKKGAVDYLMKDRIRRLPFAVKESLDKKKAEIEKAAVYDMLLQSERRYRILFDNGMFPSLVSSLDGKVVFTNEFTARFFGLNHNDLDHISTHDFWVSNHARVEYTNELIDRGFISNKEIVIQLLNRDIKTLLISSNLISFNNQIAVLSIFNDITERKNAENELAASEARLQKLLNSVTDYLYLVEIKDGKVINTIHGEGCITVTGYSNQYFEGNYYHWFNIIHEDDKELVSEQTRKLMKGIETQPLEHRINHKDGSVRWIRNTTVLRYQSDGELIGYDGLIADITERKSLERQILNSVIETEERERLYFSQELHDGIGPLLSATKMYVQWLGMPDAKTDQAKIIMNIEKLLDESSHTVREISFRLNPHILQNYGLVEAIKAYAEKIMDSSNLIFELEFKDICAIDEKIETITYRVICECTNNTIKHAEASKIRIHMLCKNNVLYVEYADNGKGFDINVINQKGIGLINMRSRIKSLNGTLEINSKPSDGTVIKFQIRIME